MLKEPSLFVGNDTVTLPFVGLGLTVIDKEVMSFSPTSSIVAQSYWSEQPLLDVTSTA